MGKVRRDNCATYLNEKGFTLIEALTALSVFLLLIFFLSPVFHIVLNKQDISNQIQQMEWTVFCSQVQKEIMTCSKGEVIGSKLMLTKDTDSILYEKYGTSLRRRVNLTGHEILLQNVQEVSFVRLKNGIMLTVTDLKGKVFSATFHSVINWDS